MTKRKLSNQFDQTKFCKTVRARYRRRFKKGMNATDAEIMKVIKDYLADTVEQVVKGKKVMFSKDSYIRVVGVPMLQHSTFGLRKVGKVLAGKHIKKADKMNTRRGDFIYHIEYITNSKEKIYFQAHPDFSRRVRKSLIETNTYYPITENCNKKKSDKKITNNCN